MFPTGVGNAYGSQSYAAIGAHRQSAAVGEFSGMSLPTADGGLPSQRLTGPSAVALQYGGAPVGSYGTLPQNSSEQLAAASVTGMGSSLLQGISSGSYAALLARGHSGQNQGAFSGSELLREPGSTYSDYIGLSHSQQSVGDQPSFFRQQLLQAQQQQSGADPRQSLLGSVPDGSVRGSDYLAARSAAILQGSQDYRGRDLLGNSYGTRIDVDPGIQGSHQLMGPVRRNLGDDAYGRISSALGYGVSLPPGRDYSTGKGLGGTPVDPSYPGSLHSRTREGHQDDRDSLPHKIEEREESLRRDRERDRERERLLERRERERDREHARKRESRRRESTPRRSSRDRRPSSMRGKEKPIRRVSPRREALHRRPSPVKEKRREYACKVKPYCLIEAERDMVSISRRYPKLSVSPEFSKLILRWPKEELQISFYQPVSFEHEGVYVSGDTESTAESTKSAEKTLESGESEFGRIIWNAKVILMSGVGSDALAQLLSEKRNDKTFHLNNILRFALLREDRAFMAIGGPWNPLTDGDDPSVDEFSLVRTAIRCTKEITQIDLANCQHWNRFLEIHYDRVGRDSLGSYREVTVMFIPDLTNCLPSLDVWQSQWISRRKERVGKEREMASNKKDKSSEKKDDAKGSNATDKIKQEKAVDSVDEKTSNDPKGVEKVKKRKRVEVNGSNSKDTTKPSGETKKEKESPKDKKEKKDKKQDVDLEDPATTGKKKTKKVVKKKAKKKSGNPDDKPDDVEVPKKVKKVKVKEDNQKEIKNAEKAGKGEKKGKKKKITKSKKDEAKAKDDDISEKEIHKDKDVKIDTPKSEEKQKEKKMKEKKKIDDGGPADSVEKAVQEKKEKGKSEAPPQHPGLFLQTKWSKNSKLRSISLSLDGLLDYNENDIDESTFELSLFAETLYEMLQYKMGCLILTFLEKLWKKYSNKRYQNKREREEKSGEEKKKAGEENNEVGSSGKRSKFSDVAKVDSESVKPETADADASKPQGGGVDSKHNVPKAGMKTEEAKEDGSEKEVAEEDPEEEDPEEEAAEAEHEGSEEEAVEEDSAEEADESDNDEIREKEEAEDGTDKVLPDSTPPKVSDPSEHKSKDKKADADEKVGSVAKEEELAKKVAANKELLQAFRFFDHEWVGFIKVEDMRTIIHNLGKFLSKRAVKELLRVAVLESNKVQDNRIYYNKLLKKPDLL